MTIKEALATNEGTTGIMKASWRVSDVSTIYVMEAGYRTMSLALFRWRNGKRRQKRRDYLNEYRRKKREAVQ
jgi:hypothetical protein